MIGGTTMRGMGLVWIAAALLAPSHVRAAGQEGMRPLDAKTAQFNMYNFTDCVVHAERYSTAFRKLMRMMPGDPQFTAAYIKAAGDECSQELSRLPGLTVRMRTENETMRDLLFGALYRRDFRKSGPPQGIATVPPLSLSSEFDGDVAAIDPTYRVRRAFGDCVARHDPQAVNDLIVARPYTDEDDAAIKRLTPILGACIPKGQTVRLTRNALREDVSEAMYKLALAAKDAHPAG
jgi:hypothetical protein